MIVACYIAAFLAGAILFTVALAVVGLPLWAASALLSIVAVWLGVVALLAWSFRRDGLMPTVDRVIVWWKARKP